MASKRQIVTFGGGGFSMEAGNPLLDEFVLQLTGRSHPRVCFLPQASGDADHYIVRFYRAFPRTAACRHTCRCFGACAPRREPRRHLLDQDLIYVGGGSVRSLIGVWRAHGIDRILHEAWHRGVVLCGLSAGSLCWFAEGVSTFHGPPERVEGLGPAAVEQHGALLQRARSPRVPTTAGCATGCARDTPPTMARPCTSSAIELAQVVASRGDARGYRVECRAGRVVTTRLATRYLGNGEAIPLVDGRRRPRRVRSTGS